MRAPSPLRMTTSAELDAWQQRGRRFAFGTHRIFYRDEGAGEALVCIHGFPTASWDWHRLWPELTRRWRVVAPDMLGFGFSDKPRAHAYSIAEQASLHEQLLASLGIGAVDVLAHDYGDTVAQELLARFEERRSGAAPGLELRSVCFLNGGLFPEVHRARFIQKLLAGPLGPLVGRWLSRRGFARSFSAIFGAGTRPSAAELADFWTLVEAGGGARISHRLLHYLEERRRWRERWVGVLATTSVPLRFINGADDPVSGRHMADRYRALVPRPDVVILEGIGHYPQVEAPEEVLAAFTEFHRGT